MTTLREAAQQALEALLTYEQYIQPLTNYFGGPRVPEEGSASAKVDAAITALRTALAQQAEPLTEEEIGAAANSVRWSEQYHIKFARAIEKAHGIGSERPATLSKPCGSLGEDI